MDINKLISNLEKLSIRDTLGDALEETKNDITEAQKDQMLHGLRADGKKIGKYKNPYYAQIKFNRYNSLAGYGYVDLAYKKEFFRNISTKILNSLVVITSSDSKTDKLIKDYSEQIFGLNPEYAGNYSRASLAPLATKLIIKQIHKR